MQQQQQQQRYTSPHIFFLILLYNRFLLEMKYWTKWSLGLSNSDSMNQISNLALHKCEKYQSLGKCIKSKPDSILPWWEALIPELQLRGSSFSLKETLLHNKPDRKSMIMFASVAQCILPENYQSLVMMKRKLGGGQVLSSPCISV